MGPADLAALAGLFASAFLAGSVLPAQSEAVLAVMLLAGDQPPWLLVLVATLGNVGGAVLNYGLGTMADRLRHRRWFPLTAAGWGAARTPPWLFLMLVTVAKGGRYLLLAAVVA